MDMKKQINMCIFVSMIFMWIQIKFDTNINIGELLENHTGTFFFKKKLIIFGSLQ